MPPHLRQGHKKCVCSCIIPEIFNPDFSNSQQLTTELYPNSCISNSSVFKFLKRSYSLKDFYYTFSLTKGIITKFKSKTKVNPANYTESTKMIAIQFHYIFSLSNQGNNLLYSDCRNDFLESIILTHDNHIILLFKKQNVNKKKTENLFVNATFH